MTNLSGRRLGQYTIVDVIGTGGMALVYRARQENMRRDVAIKIIQSSLAQNADFIRRFEREAQTIASLSSPHILKVFDYGQEQDAIYIVMELLTGGNLADEVRGKPMSYERIAELLSQISLALDYAHSRGIIHRDLKPQNVLLDEQGNAILTDFGIAKLMQEGGDTRLTQTGVAMGTPTYMSPEQWQGQPLDARSDLYSLGTMLYEMVTGRVPFNSPTPANLMYQHLTSNPPSPQTLRADVPPAIELVLNRALAKQKDDRYQSAREMAREFIAALGPSLSGSAAAYEITSKGSKPITPMGNRISGPVDVDAPTTPGLPIEPSSGRVSRSGSVASVPPRQPPPPSPRVESGAVDIPSTGGQRKFPLVPVIIGAVLVLLIGGGGAAFLLSQSNTTPTPTVVAAASTPTTGGNGRDDARTALAGANNTAAAQLTEFAVQDTETAVAAASFTKTLTVTPTETTSSTPTEIPATPTSTPTTEVPTKVALAATDAPTATEPPTETPTELPASSTPAPTSTQTPTQVEPTAIPTCASLPQATLVIKPLQATTYDVSIQFFVTTSTGVAYDTVSVTGSSGQFTFQPGQDIIVPLVPERLNNFVIIAQIATTTIGNCTYEGYPISAITDSSGGSLQVIQQSTPTPTSEASNTPTMTPTVTDTLTFTPTFTETATSTFTRTATYTFTPSHTPTFTLTPTSTIDRTATAQAKAMIATSTAAAATIAAVQAPTETVQAMQSVISDLEKAPGANVAISGKSGTITHNATNGRFESFNTGVTSRNFIARVTFTNPYDGSNPSGDKWDYGIIFRQTGTNREYRLVLLSDLGWFLLLYQGSADNFQQMATSFIPPAALHLGEGETNTIELVVDNEVGYFFLNGVFISQFALTDKMDSGQVLITVGNFVGYEKRNAKTAYSDLEVIRLP